MPKKSCLFVLSLLMIALCSRIGLSLAPQDAESMPTAAEMLERARQRMLPLAFSVEKDEVITSYTDPSKKLRRMEIRFTSQVIDGHEMIHEAAIYLPSNPDIDKSEDRRGKVVIVTHAVDDTTIELNIAEPIAARTGYPTMDLMLPGPYDGGNGEGSWPFLFRDKATETGDPSFHDFIHIGIPYLQAMDIFSEVLREKNIRAIIGGHSKRAYYAYAAAAMDPVRIAGVVFMGCERLYFREMFPEAVKPFTTQKFVRSPIFYIGATNEGGYEMFSINRIQDRMKDTWTIEYIPNYRHASRSEKQFMDWSMWVSHIFDGRPLAQISDLSLEHTEDGTLFRARVDSPNKIIQVKAWYVFCDDVPYWRDLVWYPEMMKRTEGNLYECHVSSKTPDAWLVEVKDTGFGFPGYVSSLPQDITGLPTKERVHRGPGGRNWEPKKKDKK